MEVKNDFKVNEMSAAFGKVMRRTQKCEDHEVRPSFYKDRVSLASSHYSGASVTYPRSPPHEYSYHTNSALDRWEVLQHAQLVGIMHNTALERSGSCISSFQVLLLAPYE